MNVMREIERDEIKNEKINLLTPLFVITEGYMSEQKVLLYKLRCYQFHQGAIENLVHSNNILLNLQSSRFLSRIGYINNKIEKSLTLVYKYPEKGNLFSLENLTFENEDERYYNLLKYLNDIFRIICLIKKKDKSIDMGCSLYPYIYFEYYDSSKSLCLVDCLFTYFFSSVNNNFIRNLCGFFNSNNSDEIAMSCILMAYFFRSNLKVDIIKIINLFLNLSDSDKVLQFPFASIMDDVLINNPNVQTFIDSVLSKREKEKEEFNYLQFYEMFAQFAKIEKKKCLEKIDRSKNFKDTFFNMLKEKQTEFEFYEQGKKDLDILYSYLPPGSVMSFSKKIKEEYQNTIDEEIVNKDIIKKKIKPTIEDSLIPAINKMNEGIKNYFIYKLNQIKQSKVINDFINLSNEINKVTSIIHTINNYYQDYSRILNFDTEGNDFISKMELIKSKILPPLYEANTKIIENFPKHLNLPNEVNYLISKPNFDFIKENNKYYSFINTNSDTITLFTQNDGNIESKNIKCQFNIPELKEFPKCIKWLTFSSFIIVTGGEKEENSLHLVIDLTKENKAFVNKLPKMPSHKNHHSMCKVNENTYVVVGGNTVKAELYSFLSSKWKTLPLLNEERLDGILFLFNEIDLFYFGGKEQSNVVENYKLGSGKDGRWNKIILNKGISLTNAAYFPMMNRNDMDIILIGGISNGSFNQKTYLLNITDNQIEEYNSKITFTVEYEFEENLMECINGNQFVQVGINKKGDKTLVTLDEKMFSY